MNGLACKYHFLDEANSLMFCKQKYFKYRKFTHKGKNYFLTSCVVNCFSNPQYPNKYFISLKHFTICLTCTSWIFNIPPSTAYKYTYVFQHLKCELYLFIWCFINFNKHVSIFLCFVHICPYFWWVLRHHFWILWNVWKYTTAIKSKSIFQNYWIIYCNVYLHLMVLFYKYTKSQFFW